MPGRGTRPHHRASGRGTRPSDTGHPRGGGGGRASARTRPLHRRLRTEPGRPCAAHGPRRRGRPLPGGRLTWARAEQETARGRAECGWALADGRLTITATVPPGATAHLEVPTSDPAGVREGGEAAAIRPGVLAVEPIDTGALLHLASGHYIVSAAAPDTQTPPVNSRPVLFSRETS
ncbi:alpha-L-rhamnosidase C-terminal domain-containing protein [Streptomyces niveus]|uniref:alpha-L-rhamnosidase C-terminal domain-containing protein n=1 Tax=Streptomyces niveus TaxID=193462 RepID=UPI003B59DE4C